MDLPGEVVAITPYSSPLLLTVQLVYVKPDTEVFHDDEYEHGIDVFLLIIEVSEEFHAIVILHCPVHSNHRAG